MQLISLFSGIGGFELAAEWMGWDVVASCEINPFGQRVLKHYWPEAYHHDDIHTLNYETLKKQSRLDPTRPTILTGGFPCQPYSMAGKRRGKEDDRHLWPEMCRIIREVRPDYIVGENVLGLVSWDGGLVFNEVHSDLEAEGYEVQAVVIPAAAKNAPHGRDRVWFCARLVADCTSQRLERATGSGIQWSGNGFTGSNNGSITNTHSNGQQRSDCEYEKHTGKGGEYAQYDVEQVAFTDTNSTPPQQRHDSTEKGRGRQDKQTEPLGGSLGKEFPRTDWSDFPTQSPIRNVNDGIPGIMVRNIKKEIYATISERYANKDLQEVWDALQSEEIRGKIGRLYKIHEPGLLLQTLQLCASPSSYEIGSSVFSEEASKDLMRKLQNHKTFANTPHGRELEKQFSEQFGNALPYLSHEIALVTMEAERASRKFSSWHRNESIKAAGNAIVPQVAYSIFKAIIQCENKE